MTRTADQIQPEIVAALIAGDNDRALALQCELAEINNAAEQAQLDAIKAYRAKQSARLAPGSRFPRKPRKH